MTQTFHMPLGYNLDKFLHRAQGNLGKKVYTSVVYPRRLEIANPSKKERVNKLC